MLGLARQRRAAAPQSPGIEPARAALIQQRIGELKARLAEGGAREAAIRALVYIGMGGRGRRRAGVQRIAPDPRREPGPDAAGLQAGAARAVLQPDARPRRGAGRHPEDAAGRRRRAAGRMLRRPCRRIVEAAGPAERGAGAAAGADREAASSGSGTQSGSCKRAPRRSQQARAGSRARRNATQAEVDAMQTQTPEVRAPDRALQGAAAHALRRGAPLRREFAARRRRSRADGPAEADPGRAEGAHRGRGRAVRHRHRRPANWSTRRTAPARPRPRCAWRARARSRC